MTQRIVSIRGFDPSVYLVANEFYDAATSIPVAKRHAAYIVNLSFSIELYIKSLDVSQTIVFVEDNPFADSSEKVINARVKGHSLRKMFLKLRTEIRTEMLNEYEKQFDSNLDSDLDSIQNAFVEYRYIFEKESASINLSAVERVANFLKQFTEQKYR
ncbi:TPA: hypothetical protein ACOL2D_004813 [Vibrio parahaemolyticus]